MGKHRAPVPVRMRSPWLAQQTSASRSYFVAVTALGLVAVIVGMLDPSFATTSWWGVLGWLVLAIVASFSMGLQLRRIADGAGTITMRDVWPLSALLIWGLPAALVTNLVLVVWSESVTKIRLEGRSFVLARFGFNAGFTSIALAGAGAVVAVSPANWWTWVLAGFVFEVITVIAVELHVIANNSRRRMSQSLIILVSMCLAEVPLAVALTVTREVSPLLATLMSFPILVTAAGIQYILEFIELRDLMSTDSRTGLLTSQAWREAAEKLIRTQRVVVLMADLDQFKQLNDSFGHLAGDDILKQVGDILISSIRPSDLACRWGGEEFVLVLEGRTVDEGMIVAERIRRRVASEAISNGAQVTISIGVAACPQSIGPQAQLALTHTIARADEALYQAKRDGRNRVQAVSPAPRQRSQSVAR